MKRKPDTVEATEQTEGENVFVFTSLGEARAYQQWKNDVPRSVRSIIESAMLGKEATLVPTGLPKVDAFLQTLNRRLRGDEVPATDASQEDFLATVRQIATDEGPADGLQLLRDVSVPFGTKADIWRNYLEPMVNWLAEQDLEPPLPPEKPPETTPPPESSAEEPETSPTPDDGLPPPEDDAFRPSMDEMAEQNEGERSRPQFTVTPYFGGYYRQSVYTEWDNQKLLWGRKSGEERPHELPEHRIEKLASRTLSGRVRGRETIALPLPYGWSADKDTFSSSAPIEAVSLSEDGDGRILLSIDSDGIFEYQCSIGSLLKRPLVEVAPDAVASQDRLPEELTILLGEMKKSATSSAGRARLIVKTVREHLEYSNESAMNAVYQADPAQYFERVWQEKKADCDVANTVAAAALRSAGIHVRMATGHYIKNQAPGGVAEMTSGTKHAWLEVFDPDTKKWFRADATPKGDPTLDEERPDEQSEASNEGDYGEQEAEIMSDEDLQKLIEELAKAEKQPPPKSSAERVAEKFAKEAACSEQEAREVLDMFARVREMKDSRGRVIHQRLIQAWRKLVQSRLVLEQEYLGPVRMSEGDEWTDPTTTAIDIRGGVRDPSGFEHLHDLEKTKKLFGGLDVYLSIDCSDSMNELDPKSGGKKCELQREAVMLYADSLFQCAYIARQISGRLNVPLPLRLQLVSIHGDTSVDLPLTNTWGPKEQVSLYRSLVRPAGGGTPDDEALEVITSHIMRERKSREKKPKKDGEQPPIEFVAVFLDGGSNNAAAVRERLRELRQTGTIVHGYGMTAAAKPIEANYAPDATTIETLSALAPAVANDTIDVFKKLHPERVEKE